MSNDGQSHSPSMEVVPAAKKRKSVFRPRFLILANISAIFLLFGIGVVHPYAVLCFEALKPLFLLLVFVGLVVYIVKFLRGLFRPEKKILSNLSKIGLCYALGLIFGISHPISFAGLRVHYGFVKDYSPIRAWAKGVEISGRNLIWMNGIDIPEPLKAFHPENIEVREEKGVRKVWLSWDSGFMQVGWELIVLPPNEIYQVQKGMLAKIQPGVYLHFKFYEN